MTRRALVDDVLVSLRKAIIGGVLNPGGWLGVMTKWVGSHDDFVSWRYIRDPTHVAFYSPRTLRWIAERWAAPVDFAGDNVALFRKGTVRSVV